VEEKAMDGNDRPNVKWPDPSEGMAERVLSPLHDHEFGPGVDVQYKNANGHVVGEMHGLKPEEGEVLANKSDY
jgi:hypothetical protein